MRAFIHIFLGLLMPVSLLVSILLTLFFTFEYSFTQAMSLGVLYGIFAGIMVTVILSLALQLLRSEEKNVQDKINTEEKDTEENEKPLQVNPSTDPTINKSMDHGLMLLMNKELTFELILSMSKKQVKRSITTHNVNKGSIEIKIHEEVISIAVSPLTEHTSNVVIKGIHNSKYIQDIISFIKEKEHSFLQY